MWKKIIISIVVFVFLGISIAFVVSNKERNSTKSKGENEDNPIKIQEISEEFVDDDCVYEWNDYEEYIKELEQASSMYQNEKVHYLVKSENNCITVYYVDESGNTILYKETGISINYLGEDDIKNLENGIDVYGAQDLNKLLEDFE